MNGIRWGAETFRRESNFPKRKTPAGARKLAAEIFIMDRNFSAVIGQVVASMKQAGYEPYAQLASYVNTGDVTYITRRGNARELVRTLDAGILREYLRSVSGA